MKFDFTETAQNDNENEFNVIEIYVFNENLSLEENNLSSEEQVFMNFNPAHQPYAVFVIQPNPNERANVIEKIRSVIREAAIMEVPPQTEEQESDTFVISVFGESLIHKLVIDLSFRVSTVGYALTIETLFNRNEDAIKLLETNPSYELRAVSDQETNLFNQEILNLFASKYGNAEQVNVSELLRYDMNNQLELLLSDINTSFDDYRSKKRALFFNKPNLNAVDEVTQLLDGLSPEDEPGKILIIFHGLLHYLEDVKNQELLSKLKPLSDALWKDYPNYKASFENRFQSAIEDFSAYLRADKKTEGFVFNQENIENPFFLKSTGSMIKSAKKG